MKTRMERLAALLIALALCLPLLPAGSARAETIPAEEIEKHRIVKDRMPVVVSLGDSYSSGEAGEDYYGMDKPWYERVKDQDWLAHRSSTAWSGQLTFVNEQGERAALSEYRYNPFDNEPAPSREQTRWYFFAASGAVTADFAGKQEKEYDLSKEYEAQRKSEEVQDIVASSTVAPPPYKTGKTPLIDPQVNAFRVAGDVDYVTLSIGGNDLGFVEVLEKAAVPANRSVKDQLEWEAFWSAVRSLLPGSQEYTVITYDELLEHCDLEKDLYDRIKDINKYLKDISAVYTGIHDAAPDAAIIVAGYPRLVYSGGGTWHPGSVVGDMATDFFFSESEAETINRYVGIFNNYLQNAVTDLRNQQGIPIYFADVYTAFGDHGANAPEEYINGIVLGARPGELDDSAFRSSSSFHPNAEGRRQYAQVVQKVIDSEVELDRITGRVRVVDGDYNVTAATAGYTVEFTAEDDPSWHYTLKTAADGSFESEDRVGKTRNFTAGKYSLRVLDEKNRECALLGNGGSAVVTLMYHTAKDLDILVSPGQQEVSGSLVIRTAKDRPVEMDFADDPLVLSFTDRSGRTVTWPAEGEAPVTGVGGRGVRYSVRLLPGEYTVRAYGQNSGTGYSFAVGGGVGDESVTVPIGRDVKKDLTLRANDQNYVGTWVDEINYESAFGVSAGTRMTLELGKMMDARWTLEATSDFSGVYGWDESDSAAGDSETYTGTWLEVEDGIAFCLNGNQDAAIYFDLVARDVLKLNLDKLEALASGTSQEGLMLTAMLEVFELAMSMDLGSMIGFDLGVNMNDLMGIDSTDDLLYFVKQ